MIEKNIFCALIFFSFSALSVVTQAHPQDMGRLIANAHENQMSVSLEVLPPVARVLLGISVDRLTNTAPSDRATLLFAGTFAEDLIYADGEACRWGQPIDQSVGEIFRFKVEAICPHDIKKWQFALNFFKRAPPGFEVLVRTSKQESKSDDEESIASAKNPVIKIYPRSKHSWTEFVRLGIEHIGAVPNQWYDSRGLHFPDGIDHILFVIALVLAGGGFLNILKTVTGFTIGHSLTLALATVGIVHVPSRLVEPAIALSIAVVALQALFKRKSNHNWRLAIVFGLVHGLGFASALADLNLDSKTLFKALIGFNVGVEIGQATIVLAVLPLFWLSAKSAFSRRWAVPVVASIIFLISTFWFVQRAFFGP